jgi:hypothetical protein
VIRDALLAGLLALVALAPLGCANSDSFSDSSQSSVDSSTSASRSSASSSGDDSSSDAYRDEVRTYTAGYARGGGLVNDAFKRQLAETAKRYSISNWEDKKATFEGVGAGLGQAGATQAQLDAYMAGLAGSDAGKRKHMQEAYNSSKKP